MGVELIFMFCKADAFVSKFSVVFTGILFLFVLCTMLS